MALIDIFVFIAGFGAGGAVIWFYRPAIAAGVVTVNADVVAAKTAATTVVTDIKKL